MQFNFSKLRRIILGVPLNPFNPHARRHVALVAFMAWIGLGADALSSSCYGPEVAFLALHDNTFLAPYIALAIIFTIFILSLTYNQVMELFPSGGGGYKVATQLLGQYAGLISGSALTVDYVLTITISTASGMDALFSLFPSFEPDIKLISEGIFIIFLLFMNLRGMKESIKFLLPIFIGFVITHAILIIYGISIHHEGLARVYSDARIITFDMAHLIGWMPILALLLHSYSLGSGTFTGLEAISNNVNRLASPPVQTGKWTMAYVAISLSFTASGIIILYLLYQVLPIAGQTLNATVSEIILSGTPYANISLFLILFFEAGLLFVGANTGFLGGPSVLANMAVDGWVPSGFRNLSNRLVTQNGIILFGIAALAILFWTKGNVHLLVVLYSINVFITFFLSALGICVYLFSHRTQFTMLRFIPKVFFALLSTLLTGSILIIMVYAKFAEGAWFSILAMLTVALGCLFVKKNYLQIEKKLQKLDEIPTPSLACKLPEHYPINPLKPTAVFFLGHSRGVAMHTLLRVLALYPDYYRNFIFIGTGIVDIESFRGQDQLQRVKEETNDILSYLVRYCDQFGFSTESYQVYGTDDYMDQLIETAQRIIKKYPHSIFFSSKLVFEHESWFTDIFYNEKTISLQRRLHALGKELIILPIKIS